MVTTSDIYALTRDRIADLLDGRSPHELEHMVPSCPDWTVRDLLAHVVSMPLALTSGNFPGDDLDAWIQNLVDEHAPLPVGDLLTSWGGCHEHLAPMLDGGAGVLLVDLVVHEHDLRGALDEPGDRDAPELAFVVPLILESLVPALTEAGLGSIEVRHGDRTWRSHSAEPSWVLRADPWLATRVLESRRTADEIRALDADGDTEAVIALLDAHLPLPSSSLGEPPGPVHG